VDEIDINAQIPISMPFVVWQKVLALVAKDSWENVDPIMQEMRRQILQYTQPEMEKEE